LASLNHFTVPTVRIPYSWLADRFSRCGTFRTTEPLFARAVTPPALERRQNTKTWVQANQARQQTGYRDGSPKVLAERAIYGSAAGLSMILSLICRWFRALGLAGLGDAQTTR
jgi:hypothetical protein